MSEEKTYYEQVYAILSVTYGDNEFNTIVNTNLAHEINLVLLDDLNVNKYKDVSNLLAKTYGEHKSTDYSVKSVFFAAGKSYEIQPSLD